MLISFTRCWSANLKFLGHPLVKHSVPSLLDTLYSLLYWVEYALQLISIFYWLQIAWYPCHNDPITTGEKDFWHAQLNLLHPIISHCYLSHIHIYNKQLIKLFIMSSWRHDDNVVFFPLGFIRHMQCNSCASLTYQTTASIKYSNRGPTLEGVTTVKTSSHN